MSSLGSPGRLLGALLSRPHGYGRRNRRHEDDGFTLRPNPPRMATVVAAVILTVLGLSVSGVLVIPAVNEFIAERRWSITRDHGFVALIASPMLLIAGSFLRGL